jgi:hypothetical protein
MADTLNSSKRASNAQFWEEHIAAWRSTGLSQAEYCRSNGLVKSRFWYWRRRLDRHEAEDISFVPVAVSPNRTSPPSGAIRVITPNGYRIELENGFDPHGMRQLLDAIGGLP